VQHIASVTSELQRYARPDTQLFIATDQEGGAVQRLKGPGFSTIPSGVQQGQLGVAQFQGVAQTWGAELHAAGVNVNLGPVLDTVPASDVNTNPPIGKLDREFGNTTAIVSSHGLAYVAGMTAAGVDVSIKHFPGLGRVTQNTDTTAGVTDTVTVNDDPYLVPFADAINAKVPFVMMSTAVYSNIDSANPAAFSKAIVTGILRTQLGFSGVIISDDLGQATQVSAYPAGDRAVNFIRAGGDMVLTVVTSEVGTMTAAVIATAKSDSNFHAMVEASALRVLTAKEDAKLLSGN
jgi:beta-N-acetylhexosaminidase